MKRKNMARNALFTSIISLLLCVSMLVGTTFAWFTDSVVSGNNVIASGNLDIELYHSNYTDKNEKVRENVPLFDDVTLWEPGAVAYEVLTVENLGTLALKYKLSINFTNENTVKDTGYGLSSALKVAVVDATKLTSRESALTAARAAADSFYLKDFVLTSKLEGKKDQATESETYGLVIWWEPTANDNNWNVNNGKETSDNADHLHIDLGISLVATQQTNESDSFGPDYDGESTYNDMLHWIGEITNESANTDAVNGTFSYENLDKTFRASGELADPAVDATVSVENTEVIDEVRAKLPANAKVICYDIEVTGYKPGTKVAVELFVGKNIQEEIYLFHNDKLVEGYTYNADTGVLSFETDSFSPFAVAVYDTPWNGEPDTTWYNDTATEFELNKPAQLAGLTELIDGGNTFAGKTIKLTGNVDLNGKLFDPIGSYRNEKSFMGTFDGQGYTIKNLSQNTWELNNGYYYKDCGLGLFGQLENATVKNLIIDGADISGESAICGAVAAVAHNTNFENVTVKNAKIADYQYYAGGIVGWVSGDCTFNKCNVDSNTIVAAQWGDFDNSTGGLIGGASTSAKILVKDCTISCRIDVYNDVTSTYRWYAYRRAGMLIGNSGATATNESGTNVATAPQLKCENVTVIYGDWANYTYCEFAGTSWPYVRVQAGVSNSAYSNPRYGHPTDANGNQVVDDNHVHNEGEDHFIECTFDQLYGGGQGVYGTATHEGVKVVYNNK